MSKNTKKKWTLKSQAIDKFEEKLQKTWWQKKIIAIDAFAN